MARAESFLDSLIKSVEDGTVTVARLKLLQEHDDQFLKLGDIRQWNKKVSVSIKEQFRRRISEQKRFFALREQLKCFIDFSNIFTSGI